MQYDAKQKNDAVQFNMVAHPLPCDSRRDIYFEIPLALWWWSYRDLYFEILLDPRLQLVQDLAERLDENWPLTAVETSTHSWETV